MVPFQRTSGLSHALLDKRESASRKNIEAISWTLPAKGAELVGVETNPIDKIWTDRPPAPRGAIALYPEQLAGEPATEKLARIREQLGGVDTLVVSDPHAIAWAFNIRGSDVAHTPLLLGYALVRREGRLRLYIDAPKLSNSVDARLSEIAEMEQPQRLIEDLAAEVAAKRFASTRRPRLPNSSTSFVPMAERRTLASIPLHS
jgi:Xaa-Pro aminopeptidase